MRKIRTIRSSFFASIVAILFVIGAIYFIFAPSAASSTNNETKEVEHKLILQYTPIFRDWSNQRMDGCPLKDKCSVTMDKAQIGNADAVVFHVSDLYTVSNYPLRAFQGQKHVMYSMESPINEEKNLGKVPGLFGEDKF